MFAIIELSSFGGAGPARVRSHKGISAFGAEDMAGNVKEPAASRAGGGESLRPEGLYYGKAWNGNAWSFS
jgi:hypothetical protein